MTNGRKKSKICKTAAFKKVEFYPKFWSFLARQNSMFDQIKTLIDYCMENYK